MTVFNRFLPIGAELLPESGGVHFRVYAPLRRSVEVLLEDQTAIPLEREPDGYYSGIAHKISAGARYKFRLDEADAFPDPASRFQPEDLHGFSQVVDPHAFRWTDAAWKGVKLSSQVIYEMHIGTFTPEGTYRSAAKLLPYLKETGITLLEVMPVASFPGEFGWGYDGVQPFAPYAGYGTPDDFRFFINQAHSLGMGVILDVVYNHLGPDGNYLPQYSPYYFSSEHQTDWGPAINFDGEHCQPVREYFVSNAVYWITEFHMDGLRLDATHAIRDHSKEHILAEISRATRAAAGQREIVLIAEDEPQDVIHLKKPEEGGHGFDALWNDDLHHSAVVALTGRADAYYSNFHGSAQELASVTKHRLLYQGQPSGQRDRGRSAEGVNRSAFITFLENHDQVAHSGWGKRLHQLSSPGQLKALTALVLLGSGTPMLFQGQEYASSKPFLFFADHNEELSPKVRTGRREFLAQWKGLALPEMDEWITDPKDRSTFERCILDHSEKEKHKEWYALHRDLIELRKTDPVFSNQELIKIDGALLAPECLVIRFFSDHRQNDRLLVINLGRDLLYTPVSEPLLALTPEQRWNILWSSENPRYGGSGTPPLDQGVKWDIPGQSGVVLVAGRD